MIGVRNRQRKRDVARVGRRLAMVMSVDVVQTSVSVMALLRTEEQTKILPTA